MLVVARRELDEEVVAARADHDVVDLLVGAELGREIADVAAKLSANQEIDYVVICSGSYDLLVELTARDDEHLLDVVNTQIRSIPGIRSTETFVYLRLEKQTYSWGT